MLEVYHWEPNGASARVLIALKEKGLDFDSRYIDLLSFEQHAPAYLGLNESGEAPVLVADGQPMNESSYICEYLDEAYPQPSLMPTDPLGRWAARAWQKYVDDYLAASVSELAWNAYGPPALKGRSGSSLDGAIARIPHRPRRDVWTQAAAGYDANRLAKARGRVETTIAKMEADLANSDWLAGDSYSLADIAVYAYANFLPRVTPDLINSTTAPRTMAWLQRVAMRPAVKAALAMAKTPDPYGIAAPGPEPVRWG